MLVSFQRYVGLTDPEGSRRDRRIRCKFSRERYIPGSNKLVNLDDDHYILLAKGKVDHNGMASIFHSRNLYLVKQGNCYKCYLCVLTEFALTLAFKLIIGYNKR